MKKDQDIERTGRYEEDVVLVRTKFVPNTTLAREVAQVTQRIVAEIVAAAATGNQDEKDRLSTAARALRSG